MKKIIITCVMLVLTSSIDAQTNVKLRINHLMNGSKFSLNTTTTNSLGNDFNFKRAEYYLSNFAIIHDGGKETESKDLYHLVNATSSNDLDLDSFNLTNIEKIRFSIGVDKGKNHSNPASYAAKHALSPKSPSMHWGWSSGYRFAALEGKSGNSLSKTWELHGLFDVNYFTVWLPVSATMESGSLIIKINADYAKALSGIDLTNGMVTHGENEEDLTMLENFRDSVFSNTSGVLKTENFSKSTLFSYPNPSTFGEFKISGLRENSINAFEVFNSMGQSIMKVEKLHENISFALPNPGLYFISYRKGSDIVYYEKLVVSK